MSNILTELEQADETARRVTVSRDLTERLALLRELEGRSQWYNAARDTEQIVRHARALWRARQLYAAAEWLLDNFRPDEGAECERLAGIETGIARGMAFCRTGLVWADADWYCPGMWRRWQQYRDGAKERREKSS